MARTYEVAFRITGALNGQFAAAMQAAQNAMRGLSAAARQVNSAMAGSMGTLQGYLAKLNAMAAQSNKFADLKSSIANNQRTMQAEIAKAGQLSAAYRQQKAQVDAMREAYKALTDRQNSLKNAYENAKSALQSQKAQLATLKATYQQTTAALGQNSQKARDLKSQLDNLKATIASQTASVQSAKAAYDNFKASMKGASSELKAAESALKQLGSSFGASKSKVQELYNTLKRQKAELESLKSSLAAAGYSTDHFVASEMKLRQEIAATTAAIERQRQAAASLAAAQNNLNAASNNFSEAQSAFNSVQQAVQAVAAPIVDATQNAMTFEREMSKVKSLTQMRNIRTGNTDAIAQEMAELTAEAERLGATTEFTSTEVAQAMGKFGMAGWNKDQILGVMQSAIDAASIAGDHNIMRTADVMSDDMMAFGIKAGESYKLAGGKVVDGAKYFTDALAYAWTQSNVDRESFHEAFKYNAPGAKAAGLTLGETFAQNMFVANAGIKGSMAGTSFRAGWTRFLAPPKTAQKSLEEMGMAASDATKSIMEAQAALNEAGASENDTLFDKITKAYNYYQTLDQNHKAGWLKNLVGQTALSGWQIAFDKGGIEEITRIAKEIDSGAIAGWASDTATVMRDNTATSIEYVKSALDALSRSVGSALLPALNSAAQAISPIITSMAQWAAQHPRIIQGVVGIVAALSGLALAATGIAVAFAGWSFITTQIAMVSAGMAAVRGGMLATEIASMGMAARIGAAYVTMSASVTGAIATLRGITWGGLFAGLTAQLAAARVAVTGFFASLSVGSIVSGVTAALGRVATAIMGVGRAAMAFAFSPIGAALMVLALAAYVIYQNWDRLVPVFSSVGSAISSALSAAGAAVGNLVSALGTVGNALLSAFQALDNAGGGDVIIRVFLGIVNVLAGVAVSIINIFSSVVNTVAHMFDGLGKAISAALEGEFSEAAGHMKDTLSNIQNDWKNIHFSKLDFGYDIGANYQKSLETYRNAKYAQPAQQAIEQPSAISQATQIVAQPATPAPAATPVPTPVPAETPNLDISAVQAQMQALGTAAEQPTQTLPQISQGAEQFNQSLQNFPQSLQPTQEALANFPQSLQPTQEALANFPQSLQPAQEALANFPSAIEPATTALQNVATTVEPVNAGFTALTSSVTAETAATTAHTAAVTENTSQVTASSSALQAFIAALQATLGALSSFTAALMSTIGGLTALASSSSSAASSVSALGTAASSAASAMSSAASSIASAASSAASAAASASAAAASAGAAKPAANYKGGIYDKGAFLTWFAEKSPEAAIPLDKSQRAINLWTQAGQILGVLPNDSPINTPSAPVQNGSTRREIISAQREKMQRAQAVYNSIVNQQHNSTTPKILTERERYGKTENLEIKLGVQLSRIANLQSRVQNIQAAQFDELGNIIGLNGAASNIITKHDSEQIKQVKQERQLREYREKLENNRITSSRSYQAIIKANNQTARRQGGSSILSAPAQYELPTDRYQNLSIGGFNLRNIPFIGKIFDKANDALRGIFGKQPVDIFSGIGKNVDYDIMHPTGTFPTLPAEKTVESNLQTSLPTDIFKNIGGIDLGNVPIIGGLISKANDSLRGIFGKQPVDIFSGIGKNVDYDIMHPTGTFPTLPAEKSTSMLERVNTLQSSVLSDERLESVTPLEGGTSAYSAETFQPTFNITVNITGGGENLDTQKIGERIAFSARESFEKEFKTFMREKSRRSFA